MKNFQANDLFADRYILLKKIGMGGFAEVWKAKRKEGSIIQAIKIFHGIEDGDFEQAKAEFEQFYDLNHHRILKATDYGIYNSRPYLVMPFCEEGNALKKAGQLTEKELAKVALDISSALAFLHGLESHIIHQDIKPDNFLIDNDSNFLLADFGISKQLKKSIRKSHKSGRRTEAIDSISNSGTTPLAYRPPETFATEISNRKPIKASDVWALGVSLFELASDELPFGDFGGLTQIQGMTPPNLSKQFSEGFNSLLHSILAENPWERPTAEQIAKIAQNYLNTNSWTLSKEKEEGKRSNSARETIVKEPSTVVATTAAQSSAGINIETSATIRNGKQKQKQALTIQQHKRNRKWLLLLLLIPILGSLGFWFSGNNSSNEDNYLDEVVVENPGFFIAENEQEEFVKDSGEQTNERNISKENEVPQNKAKTNSEITHKSIKGNKSLTTAHRDAETENSTSEKVDEKPSIINKKENKNKLKDVSQNENENESNPSSITDNNVSNDNVVGEDEETFDKEQDKNDSKMENQALTPIVPRAVITSVTTEEKDKFLKIKSIKISPNKNLSLSDTDSYLKFKMEENITIGSNTLVKKGDNITGEVSESKGKITINFPSIPIRTSYGVQDIVLKSVNFKSKEPLQKDIPITVTLYVQRQNKLIKALPPVKD